jgi:glycosyltransferase involved in cell wall biosynthesis/GT2 family glycosyltransferase
VSTPITQQPRLERVESGVRLSLSRGQCAVCIPVYGGYELFAECLTSVLRHTPPDITVLIADDASPEPEVWPILERAREAQPGGPGLVYLQQPQNLGFVGNVNTAFAAAAPADVVILNSDCVVAAGWFEGLRDAALSDTTIATATALTNHGTIVTVPRGHDGAAELPEGWDVDRAAAAIRGASRRIRPRIPTAIGHCVYVRRAALELVGAFDEAFSPGYGEEVDFSQRCVARGLTHVVADEVFVYHAGGGSFGTDDARNEMKLAHERMINVRHPSYPTQIRDVVSDRRGALSWALGTAERALTGLTVTIDGTALGPHLNGTQMHILDLIAALSRAHAAHLRVLVAPEMGDDARRVLESLEDVQVVPIGEVDELEPTHIIHRPWQIGEEETLERLLGLGDRLIVTQLDLIAFRNPTYFADGDAWFAYRSAIRASLRSADAVLCISDYIRDDMVREGLSEPARTVTIFNGIDHTVHVEAPPAIAPEGAAHLDGERLILCLGADYQHKNRLFAIELADRLRREHGWDGHLVLAGPHIRDGSSLGAEDRRLARDPDLGDRVTRLGSISEAEKRWLLDRTALLLYPTTTEGFGLVPFEAAALGIPCAWAAQASLADVLPPELAVLVPWDLEASATACQSLLTEPAVAEAQVAAVRHQGERFTWAHVAQKILAVYHDTVNRPSSGAVLAALGSGWLNETAIKLIGPGGLSPEKQRVVYAIARRRWASAILFGPLFLAHRLAVGLKRLLRRSR